MSSHEHLDAETRIAQLEQRVADLTALLERISPNLAEPDPNVVEHLAATEVHRGEIVPADEAPASSRRNMLKLVGAAAAGAVAITATKTSQVAAGTNDPWLVGTFVNPDTGDITGTIGTVQAVANSASAQNGLVGYKGVIFGWDTATSGTEVRAGVLGAANPFLFTGTNQSAHGVVGVSNAANGTGSGVYGISNTNVPAISAGVRAYSENGPAIQLDANLAGPPTADAWSQGALLPDTAGNLWVCVASGTPGTWRKLAGPGTGGAFHPISPSRVYDSRLAEPAGNVGLVTNGSSRTISVADQRDLTTGAVASANVVPAGATAVTANVTVTDTQGNGFLAINPGGDAVIKAAAVNWAGNGLILNNGLNLTLNGTREVTIICGGGGNTHVVVDVTGYFL